MLRGAPGLSQPLPRHPKAEKGLIDQTIRRWSLNSSADPRIFGRNPPAACRRPKGRFGRKSGRPSAYLDLLVARTIVYIDGFNLYYRALKGTPHKWLDIEAMSRAALPSICTIERVNYY